jgi:hypothetical protein
MVSSIQAYALGIRWCCTYISVEDIAKLFINKLLNTSPMCLHGVLGYGGPCMGL